jgi:hypothetical protein
MREHHAVRPAGHLHHGVERRGLELHGVGKRHGLLGPTGDADLDEVGTGIEVRAGARGGFRRAVHRRAPELTYAALGPYPGAGRDHARPGHASLCDLIPEPHPGAAGGAEIYDGGEPGPERRQGVRIGVAGEGQMHVRVDQPGQNGAAVEVHHLRVPRDRLGGIGRPDRDDLAVAHHDDAVRLEGAGAGVEPRSAAEYQAAARRGRCPGRYREPRAPGTGGHGEQQAKRQA